MKKAIALALIMALCLSLAGVASAYDQENIDSQIELIGAKFSELKQDEEEVWSYAVTDLDHNGRLELLATSIQGNGRHTQLKAWEVAEDGKSLAPCTVNVPEGSSFPDMIAAKADTYCRDGNWYYMFDDSATLSATEVMTTKCSVQMKNGTIGYTIYASQATEFSGSLNIITFTDPSGRIITPEDYNAAGANAFAGAEKSSTNFDWFLPADSISSARFSDSYAVFNGNLMPVQAPVEVAANPAPVPSAAPVTQQNTVLMITKHPSSESHKPGETALFVANANNWTSVTWSFVGPTGGEYSAQAFGSMFPKASVSGVSGSTLTISNVAAEMNGWSAYATFYTKNGQTARTNAAYLYVSSTPAATTTTSNSISGVVLDASTMSLYLSNGSSVNVPWGICSLIYGDLATGCSCTVYYYGTTPTAANIYHVDIYGSLTGYTTTYYTYYCPNCGGSVSANADVCPHCGYSFTAGSSYTYYCPSCSHQVSAEDDVCPYCGYIFTTGSYIYDDDYDEVVITEDPEYYIYEDYSDDVMSCPSCYHSISSYSTVCPYCGYNFYGTHDDYDYDDYFYGVYDYSYYDMDD